MSRKSLNTNNYRKRKKLRKLIGWLSFLTIISLFVYAMNQPYFFLKELRINGNQTLTTRALEETVNEHLGQSWLGIIPRRNLFFYGKSSLENKLSKTYPKIYKAEISTHVSELNISIEERDTHSLWCVEKEYLSVFDEECYFADQYGLWYSRAPYFSDNVFTKIYLDPRVDSILPGERFLGEDDFKKLFVFIRELQNDHDLHIKKIVFKAQGDADIYLRRLKQTVYSNEPVVRFNTKDSYERIHRNLGIIFEQEDFVKDFESRPEDLESIDVRFDGRIFYKFTAPNNS